MGCWMLSARCGRSYRSYPSCRAVAVSSSSSSRICQIWVQKAMEENFLQGDEEKLLGLPVHALNDREKANLPYGQIGFIEYLVAPFLLTVTKVWGQLGISLTCLNESKHFDLKWLKFATFFNTCKLATFRLIFHICSLWSFTVLPCWKHDVFPGASEAIWLFWQVLPPAEDMLMQLMLNLKSWHKRWEVHQLHTEWNAVEH